MNLKDNIQSSLLQFVEAMPASKLKDAAVYAIQAGGKRFRPLVVLTLIESYGLDPLPYLDIATAIEMIHLYSLIHDDLPAMDNDSLRHGVPTIHKQFDEATAILLGDGLLTNAFERVTRNQTITPEQKVKILQLLSVNAGLQGMVYGQHLDMEAEGKQVDASHLQRISEFKTGKLLEASFRMGAIIASAKEEDRWGQVGLDLGLMFQIQDDVLEVTVSEAELKKSKSDVILEKATFVSQLGLQASKDSIEQLYGRIQQSLKAIKVKNNKIELLINKIYDRRY
jgi:geranylgeranyl diphosphate synthase, type II